MHFLIVDEESGWRAALETALAAGGGKPAFFSTGKNALSHFADSSFDGVAVGHRLSDMSGLDVIREIRIQDGIIPIVFLAEPNLQETSVAALRSGATALITKSDEPLFAEVLSEQLFCSCRATSGYPGSGNEHRRLPDVCENIGESGKFSTSTDLTDIRSSEQRLSLHLEKIPIGAIAWDENFECTLWNAAAERIFGFSKSEAIGCNALRLLVPESIQGQIEDVFSQLMSQKGGDHNINENLTKAGKTILCEWFNTPLIDEHGKAIGVASVVQDVTERQNIEEKLKESEETFRSFYQIVPDVFMITDLENAICVDVNDGFSNVTGYDRQDVIGKSTLNLHLWEDDDDRQKLVAGLKKDQQISNLQANFRRKDGTLWPGIMSGCVVSYQGRPHALTSTKDVSDMKRSQIKAEAANRAKSDFLATMSHEIRTPMTGVMGFAEDLLHDNLPPESQAKVRRIRESAKSLLHIINEILDISKMEAGKMEIETLDFDLSSLAREVVSLFLGSGKPKLDIELSLAGDLPPSVHSDPTRLRQILINLVGNAVKFTKEGRVTLSVELRSDDDDVNVLCFTVSDTGIGIAEETLPRLFTEFVQADSSVTREFEGTGLGLAICKRLVELMGGTIGVTSELGVGSTFWFTLPYVPATSNVLDHEATGSRNLVDIETIRPLHILIAEDNEVNQLIIAQSLDRFGHTYEITYDGEAAVKAHEEREHDLILMDVRMPKVSGPDATRIIRRMSGGKSKVPIIALTADAMVEHQAGYFAAGMDGVATKPIDLYELATTINEVMHEDIHAFRGKALETEASGDRNQILENVEDEIDHGPAVESFLDKLDVISRDLKSD